MASNQKPQARSVLITLSAQNYRPDFMFPERRVLLESKTNPSIVPIGRTSRRFAHLGAKVDNCYFDSPVMSRDHAEISVDWYHKRVYIKDVGSLHGTFQNSQRLLKSEPSKIVQGDTIKFGIDIQRSNELFPPCTIEVHFEFDPSARQAEEKTTGRPTFRVPDESDSSDNDDSESDIRPTVEKLRKIDQQRSDHLLGRGSLVDLTEDALVSGHQVEGAATVTIVIDDDTTEDAAEPTRTIPSVPQPGPSVAVDLDAPHDEEEDIPQVVHDDVADPQPLFDSDSESDDSYADNDSMGYPEDELSSQDQAHDSNEEEICLSDSLSGSDSDSHSDEDRDVSADSDKDSVSADEDFGDDGVAPPAEYVEDCPMSDAASLNEYESQVDAWDHHLMSSAQPLRAEVAQDYPSSYNQPRFALPSIQSSITYDVPPITWDTLPTSDQSQPGQTRLEQYRLAPMLNQHGAQLGSASDMNAGIHRFPPVQSFDNTTQRPWHRSYVAQQPVGDTIEQNPWCLPQNDGPSADYLGQRTGKPEFFAAREHNKAAMRRQEEIQHESPVPQAPAPPAVETAPSKEIRALQAHATVTEAPKSTKVPESAWATEGNKFLNSPQDFPLSNVRESSPEFDMTSAFQFHQSKLAASSSQAPAVPPSTMVDVEQAEPAKSPKRKADEISTLLPEEQVVEVTAPSEEETPKEIHDVADKQPTAADRATSTGPTTSSTSTSEPPTKKRFRFLPSLESCRTFGAGGLMVTSVVVGLLASTAPAL